MPKRSNETITLGSGKLFVKEYLDEIPAVAEIEKEENRIGWIKGGAALNYSAEDYSAEDDLGMVSKRKINAENVTLTSGIMTWNGKTLEKLCATARITEENGKRITKIGGINNDNGKQYIVHFLHEDEVDGNVRVTLVGKNASGFTLTFAKDAETVVDAEFAATKGNLDKEGTLVIIEEETGVATPAPESNNEKPSEGGGATA